MATKKYDRDGAIAYAKSWWNGHNSAFPDYDNDNNSNTSDCANFVSQCLREGGKVPEKFQTDNNSYDKWYFRSTSDRTPSWTGAQSLRLYVKYNTVGYPRLPATFLSSASGLQKGDLVFQLDKKDGASKNDRVAGHVAIVSRLVGSSIYVYAHSAAKNDQLWTPAAADTIFCKFDDYVDLGGGSSTTFPADVNQGSKKTGYISTANDPLTIRSGPGTNHGSVGTAAKGSTVEYYTTSLSTAWYYVVQGTLRGYGSAQYITQSSGGSSSLVGKTGKVVVNSAGLNIRTSANGPLASWKLYNGHRITVLEVSTAGGYTWYRLRDEQGRTNGWGRSDFITLD